MNPKASVLLITYNHAPYVAEAIESALAQQTGFAYEIVIGDDCSTDGTRHIVVDYQRRFPDRIRLVLPDQNLGALGNRLFLEILAACRGDYVAFLDGDDYWTSSDKLQRQVAFLDAHPECAACFHNARVVYESENREPYSSNPPDQKEFSTVADLLRGNFIQTCSAMVRREPFQKFPDWLYTIDPQDWAIYILAALHGTVGYIDEVMGVYRRHKTAAWYGHSSGFHLEKAIAFYEVVGRHLGSEYDAIVKEQSSRRYYDLSRVREQEGDRRAAAVCLTKSMEGHPGWMEDYLPGIGARGTDVWQILGKRLRLYQRPALYRLHRWGTEVWDWPRWKWFVLWRMCAAVWRLVTGKSVGSLVACPTRVREQGGSPGLGATRLYWVAIRTHALEVRVGGPVGPVFQHCPRVVGRAETGVWVHDRMLFFLQDVAGSRPVTLDVVRVRVATSGRIKKTVLGRAFEWLATKLDG